MRKTGDIVEDIIETVLENCEYEVEVQGYHDYGVTPIPSADLKEKIEKILTEK